MGRFIVNLSALGPSPGGMGVYSKHCTEYLERAFKCEILGSSYVTTTDTPVIESPKTIAMNFGRFAAFERLWYAWNSRRFFPVKDNVLMYSPTQHGFFYGNQIITVHDLIYIHYPAQHLFQHLHLKWIVPIFFKYCKAIFTVSETAKRDIAQYYSVDEKKIYVVPNGVDTRVFYPSKQESRNKNEKRYLLVIGASHRHKNIEELLENYHFWKGEYKLKITSFGKHKLVLQSLVRKLDISDHVEFLDYVSLDDLVKLYQECVALIYPSLWEGFGIPPLEVMACGRPAVVSNIPVHREILGEAAIYVTLGDQESWRAAFLTLKDKEKVQEKIDAGLSLSRNYSWENSGIKLVDALLDVEPELAALKKT